MFVGVVEFAERVKYMAAAARKRLDLFEEGPNPRARSSDYSVTSPVERCLVVSKWELHSIVLGAAIKADHRPDDVIQYAPKIVHCVSYYRRDSDRNVFDKADPNEGLIGALVVANFKSVGAPRDKSFKRFVKVCAVMLSPQDFCENTFKHPEVSPMSSAGTKSLSEPRAMPA